MRSLLPPRAGVGDALVDKRLVFIHGRGRERHEGFHPDIAVPRHSGRVISYVSSKTSGAGCGTALRCTPVAPSFQAELLSLPIERGLVNAQDPGGFREIREAI